VPGAAPTYHWDFGDGATSHERNPVHVYAANGTYNVKLTVTGPNGPAELVRTDFVVVGPPGVLPVEREPNDALATANDASNSAQPFAGPRYQLSIRGEINPGADTDFFRLGAMQAGDVLTVDLAGSGTRRGTLPEARVLLYRHNGGSPLQVAADDDSGPGPDARVRFTVAAADTYFVTADTENDAGGTYDVGVWLENAAAAPATGGSFRQESGGNNNSAANADDAGGSWRVVETLSTTDASVGAPADVDNFRYRFSAGEVVTILSDSTSSAQTRVRLRSASNTILAEDDRGADGLADSGIHAFTVPATGDYYVEVRSASNTGAYSINVYRSASLAAALPPAPPPGDGAGGADAESEVRRLLSGV
jgi:PKD repeat protein